MSTNKAAMLEAYREVGTVLHAVDIVGISRQTHYEWLRMDAEFAQEFADACEDRADMLEREAFRRAHDGTLRPVFQGGQHVGDILEFSDTLMLAMLKAHRPEKFKERQEITGPRGGPLQSAVVHYNLEALTTDELTTLRGIQNRLAITAGDRDGAGQPEPE